MLCQNVNCLIAKRIMAQRQQQSHNWKARVRGVNCCEFRFTVLNICLSTGPGDLKGTAQLNRKQGLSLLAKIFYSRRLCALVVHCTPRWNICLCHWLCSFCHFCPCCSDPSPLCLRGMLSLWVLTKHGSFCMITPPWHARMTHAPSDCSSGCLMNRLCDHARLCLTHLTRASYSRMSFTI